METRKQARERKARWRKENRERLRQEEAAKRARERTRELLAADPDPSCGCCGESEVFFLVLTEKGIRCRNCAYAEGHGLCPHQGISRRLG